MPAQLNHTIVWCRNKERSSALLARILGCAPPTAFFGFLVVKLANDVSLDFKETTGPITQQHYAFLIDAEEFAAAFSRLRQEGLNYWADPMKAVPNQTNHGDGGQGVYFEDLDGHMLELMTRAYGSG
jgi:catechol 2,3-dioxygenase-like lactoylglutathione lyase family enzyme